VRLYVGAYGLAKCLGLGLKRLGLDLGPEIKGIGLVSVSRRLEGLGGDLLSGRKPETGLSLPRAALFRLHP